MTKHVLTLGLVALVASGGASAAPRQGARFEWSTKSAEAKKLLAELQGRIESFQFGPENAPRPEDRGRRSGLAHGRVLPLGGDSAARQPSPPRQGGRAFEEGSEGERRFIAAMVIARANQGADFAKADPDLEKLAADFPKERLVRVLLGQIYQNNNEPDKAHAVFEQAGPSGPRASACAPSSRTTTS